MSYREITATETSSAKKVNDNGKERVVFKSTVRVEFDNGFKVDVVTTTFSDNDNEIKSYASENYQVNVQKTPGVSNVSVKRVSENRYMPNIFAEMPFDESEKAEVYMKTTAHSDKFGAAEALNIAKCFNVASREIEWITEVVNQL